VTLVRVYCCWLLPALLPSMLQGRGSRSGGKPHANCGSSAGIASSMEGGCWVGSLNGAAAQQLRAGLT
jgi:hypothetical protein